MADILARLLGGVTPRLDLDCGGCDCGGCDCGGCDGCSDCGNSSENSSDCSDVAESSGDLCDSSCDRQKANDAAAAAGAIVGADSDRNRRQQAQRQQVTPRNVEPEDLDAVDPKKRKRVRDPNVTVKDLLKKKPQ